MFRTGTVIIAAALAVILAAAQETPALKTQKDKASYALGMDFGSQLRKNSIDVDPTIFYQGMKDSLSGAKTQMTEQQVKDAILELQAELKKRATQKTPNNEEEEVEARLLAAYNKKAGDEYQANNGVKQGVVTLPSGLQYRILKTGSGRKPAPTDTVKCHYRGALINGTEIYNTYHGPEPKPLKVNGVIKGFTEALQLMPLGSKWELVIPPSLAYGEAGAGPVGPNSTLVYELELIAIQ